MTRKPVLYIALLALGVLAVALHPHHADADCVGPSDYCENPDTTEVPPSTDTPGTTTDAPTTTATPTTGAPSSTSSTEAPPTTGGPSTSTTPTTNPPGPDVTTSVPSPSTTSPLYSTTTQVPTTVRAGCPADGTPRFPEDDCLPDVCVLFDGTRTRDYEVGHLPGWEHGATSLAATVCSVPARATGTPPTPAPVATLPVTGSQAQRGLLAAAGLFGGVGLFLASLARRRGPS